MGKFIDALEKRIRWDSVAMSYPASVRSASLKNAILEAVEEDEEEKTIFDEKFHKSIVNELDMF